MTTINLLPWRERLREERKRTFLMGLAGSALLSILVMALVHFAISGRISSQESRNSYLNAEIKALDAKIREINAMKEVKADLLARILIIQELQGERAIVVHMFDELVKALPKGVHLTSIKRQGQRVTLEGKAESNGNVSNLMRNIVESRWFKNPSLHEIKTDQKDGKRISQFSLNLSLVNHNAKEVQ